MPKTKISEFSATPANNTDIDSINIAEGCAPSGINDAIRELMAQLKDFQTGAVGDSFNGPVGTTTAAAGAFTTLSASSTLAVTGVATLTAQPILSSLTASRAVFTDASKGLVSNAITGTGNVVMSTSPTLVTPVLGAATGTSFQGIIGNVTPAAGAFTTVDASGAVTLSGGTANGVTYLNGSKVLTSGSALTWNGTTLGVSAAGAQLSVTNSSGGTVASFTNSTSADLAISLTSGVSLITPSTGILALGVANTETVRLTSSSLYTASGINVSIGSTSTIYSSRFSVAYDGNAQNGPTFADNRTFAINRGGNLSLAGQYNTAGNYRPFGGISAGKENSTDGNSAGYLTFRTNNNGADTTEWMRLDSSGNLGLGVTPSAFGGGMKAYQVGRASLAGLSNTAYLLNNAYYDGSGYKYIDTDYANLYSQNNTAGQHAWWTAPSGTAGNAISFTQAMTLDASGNLGVGTTTPLKFNTSGSSSAKLLTLFNSGTNAGTRAEFQIGNASTTAGDATGVIMFGCGASTTTANQTAFITSELTASSTSVAYGALVFGTANGATAVERARIDSSGNVGIGTTSPSFRLHAVSSSAVVSRIGSSGGSGAFINFIDSGASPSVAPSVGAIGNSLVFMGDGSTTERARIDSSGNLLVGTTSLPASSRVKGFAALSNSTSGIQIYQTQNNSDWAINTTSGNVLNFYSDSGSALVYSGSIAVNGVVTTYGSVSDYRLKENVQPMQGALAKVLQLKPVTFAFKNSGQVSQGFIAHELQEVCPDAVTGEKDAVDADGKPQYQGIDTSFLVATLTAAIQEQQAMIESLRQRLSAANF